LSPKYLTIIPLSLRRGVRGEVPEGIKAVGRGQGESCKEELISGKGGGRILLFRTLIVIQL